MPSQLTRDQYGRILSLLVRQFRDIALAEDALQDAMVAALDAWTERPPDRPEAWLFQTAKRKAIDRIRRDQRFGDKVEQIRALAAIDAGSDRQTDLSDPAADSGFPDERLRLIFTCCHPALEGPARVALTLKTLCGLSTAEIASAFLVVETTMAQRIVRAKSKIKRAGVPYRVPDPALLDERRPAVLAVIYLIFNEGYYRSTGETLTSTDLCDEAIFLGRMMLSLMPDDPEVAGLLALMLFHSARFDAREDSEGELVDLEHQDRGLWDREAIVTADKLLRHALTKGRPGPYQIQAAISALHCNADSFESTDWTQMVALYRILYRMEPGPIVGLNLAIALSFAEGPIAALDYMNTLPGNETLQGYHPWHTARAALLARVGEYDEARRSYRTAITLCVNASERRHLGRKLRALD